MPNTTPLALINCDSLNKETGDRITTFVLPRFPKLIQAELARHRALSQSHYSSRAIPIEKVIKQVKEDPFVFHWTRWQKGMGGSDDLNKTEIDALTGEALLLRDETINRVLNMMDIGAAKQEVNRYLEPWMHGPCVVTATQDGWRHFFKLRTAIGVQPDFRFIALEMQRLYNEHEPTVLALGDWHIPWVDQYIGTDVDLPTQLAISAARSARVSYKNHDGDIAIEKDIALCQRLLKDEHSSPFEMQAKAVPAGRYRNFSGFMHQRQHIEEKISIYA